MAASGGGVIVNVSSIQGRVATPLEGPYSSSKFALESLSETLRYELGHFGIRVVLVEPGYTGPGMKPVDDHPGDPAYAELWAQWRGTDAKVTGDGGRTPRDGGRRDAGRPRGPGHTAPGAGGGRRALVLGARSAMDDAAFEATMRSVLGATW